jgi:hypothetical protein
MVCMHTHGMLGEWDVGMHGAPWIELIAAATGKRGH